jgi:hypothetical protein
MFINEEAVPTAHQTPEGTPKAAARYGVARMSVNMESAASERG